MRKITAFLVLLAFWSFTVYGYDVGNPRAEVCRRINTERSKVGLKVLKVNSNLQMASQDQANWMASVRRMEHLRAEARSFEEFKTCNWHPANRVVNAGYFKFEELFRVVRKPGGGATVFPLPSANENVGEIIAHGSGGGPEIYQPSVIVAGWMKSPGHRKTILTPNFEEFGVGITATHQGDVFWCVVFANH